MITLVFTALMTGPLAGALATAWTGARLFAIAAASLVVFTLLIALVRPIPAGAPGVVKRELIIRAILGVGAFALVGLLGWAATAG